MFAAARKKASACVTLAAFAAVVFGAPIYEVVHGNWPMAVSRQGLSLGSLRSGAFVDIVERRLEGRSQLDDQVRPLYNEARFLATGLTQDGVVVGPNDWLFPSHRMRTPTEEEIQLLETGAQTLGKLVARLEKMGTRVVVEICPRKTSIYPEELPSSFEAREVNDYDRVLGAMRRAGLDAPDLRPALLEGDVLRYYKNDVHWNGEGCRAAAGVIADRVIEVFGTPLPGRQIQTEVLIGKPIPFIGRQQSRLGFREDGRLYKRFTDYNRPQLLRIKGQARRMRPVTRPCHVVHIGTSMSTGATATSLMLSNTLGVAVEDRSKPGFDWGYRFADLMRDIWTAKHPWPKVLVLEFPEDFPLFEGQYFTEPLLALQEVMGRAPYLVNEVPLEDIATSGIRRNGKVKDLLQGRLQRRNASFRGVLPEPVLPNTGSVLAMDLTFPEGNRHRTTVVVEWYAKGKKQPIGRKAIHIGVSIWLHPILVNLIGPGTEEITSFRVVLRAQGNTVQLGRVEQWKPRRGR